MTTSDWKKPKKRLANLWSRKKITKRPTPDT